MISKYLDNLFITDRMCHSKHTLPLPAFKSVSRTSLFAINTCFFFEVSPLIFASRMCPSYLPSGIFAAVILRRRLVTALFKGRRLRVSRRRTATPGYQRCRAARAFVLQPWCHRHDCDTVLSSYRQRGRSPLAFICAKSRDCYYSALHSSRT